MKSPSSANLGSKFGICGLRKLDPQIMATQSILDYVSDKRQVDSVFDTLDQFMSVRGVENDCNESDGHTITDDSDAVCFVLVLLQWMLNFFSQTTQLMPVDEAGTKQMNRLHLADLLVHGLAQKRISEKILVKALKKVGFSLA